MKNFRDFACNSIKKNIFLRGEALNKISKKEARTLLNNFHLKTVVDLRTNNEFATKKDKIIPGVNYIHLPVIQMEEMGAESEKEGKQEAAKKQQLPSMFKYYGLMVGRNKKEFWSKVFEILLDNDDGAIFFHCTVGKDRTGIVAAIILSLFGVSKEDIYKDYLLTNEHPVIPFIYRLYSLKFKKEVRKQFFELFYVKTEYLDYAFSLIDETYGSLDNFYKECCSLDEQKINKLKAKYLIS